MQRLRQTLSIYACRALLKNSASFASSRENRQKKQRLIALALGYVALLTVIPAEGLARSANVSAPPATASELTAIQASKIAPRILQDTSNGQSAEMLVVMKEQIDVQSANSMRDQDARGWYVYNTLRSHAYSSQKNIRAAFEAEAVPYRSFWVINALLVKGDRALLERLAARDDVSRIESNRPTRWIEGPEILNPEPADQSPNIVEWGVANVRAPEVWAMGYRGQGIVVGNLDTGVTWGHSALQNQYRGWNGTTADHNYNWWDAIHSGGGNCGPNTRRPCDDVGHGTHTTGIIIGEDASQMNQIGVAPAAKWIGCRNMNEGIGTPATYTECFQFTIAPTDLQGQNPDPTRRPHVLNNSWGCPPNEGCAPESLRTIIENVQAAGIFVEASAGNAGPACTTVNTPPGLYEAAFTTGATDSINALADFSSRGPVTADGSNRLKPNIVAPGVNIRSSYGLGYAMFSGTSMAGPHVVGVVALLWSARPELARQIAETRAILQNTASADVAVNASTPYCGNTPPSQIPNNYFGYGRVDALAAVQAAQGTPTPIPTNTPPGASPTPCVGSSQVFMGEITSSDPTQAGILPRTGVASSCSQPGACNPPLGGARHYDLIAIPNTTGSEQCVIIDIYTNCSDTHFIYSVAYLNSFDPTNLCAFRIGEAGASPNPTIQYSVTVPTGATLVINVHEVTANAGCTGYTVTVSGLSTTCVSPTVTAISTPSSTTIPSSTSTPSATRMPSVTTTISTPVVSATATYIPQPPTDTPAPTTACTVRFQDVPPDHTFYPYVRCIACRGIVSGYSDGTFRPNNDLTRGQLSKIVSNSAGFMENPGSQIFEDVPPGSPFYDWIQRLASRGHIGGYPCGSPGEPCVSGKPYFRPNANATRAQISKIVSNAREYNDPPGAQIFEDVPPTHGFYDWIQRLTQHGAMGGYECGGVGEPCRGGNRPYFRPQNNATRGQTSKIVSNTFFPGCNTPSR